MKVPRAHTNKIFTYFSQHVASFKKGARSRESDRMNMIQLIDIFLDEVKSWWMIFIYIRYALTECILTWLINERWICNCNSIILIHTYKQLEALYILQHSYFLVAIIVSSVEASLITNHTKFQMSFKILKQPHLFMMKREKYVTIK